VRPVPRRFRVAKRLREFLPDKPSQLVLLMAAFCLSSCFGRSWLVFPQSELAKPIGLLSRAEYIRLASLTQILAVVLLLAGAGAYFCCLWRQEDAARKWKILVIGPACIGILCGLFVPPLIVLNQRSTSVLDTGSGGFFRAIKHLPLKLLVLDSGTGFQLAALGLILAIVGWLMVRKGVVSLPLRFPGQPDRLEDEQEERIGGRWRLFALYLLSFFTLGGALLSLALSPLVDRFLSWAGSQEGQSSFVGWFYPTQSFLNALPVVLLAIWSIGDRRRKQLREAARLPSAWALGLGFVLAVGAPLLPHLVAYGIDRIAWAHHWAGVTVVPMAGAYFHLPPPRFPLVLYAIVAVMSEWTWRGCAQPEFVRIFGLPRGIFLLGLLYGSVQQLSFPILFHGLAGFFCDVVLRLIWGIVWSGVFGWLTLRARSVWPAAIVAALNTVWVHAAMADVQEMIPRQYLRLSMLAAGCVILFLAMRYSGWMSEPGAQRSVPSQISESTS
jgi:hypothetical protein